MKIRLLLPLLAVCAGQLFAAPIRDVQTGEKISIETADGVIISGLYHRASSYQNKTFVLLHGLGSTQEEWQQFVDKLVNAGYGTFSYDARGHGKSTAGRGGVKISYDRFGPPGPGSEWEKMQGDLDKVVAFLVKEKNIPERRIGLIGASLGANVALIYAAKTPEIPMVVLLSPGMNYAGFGTTSSIEAMSKRPISISASPQDTYAYQSSILLYNKIQDNKKAAFLPGTSGHGVQMFDGKFDYQLLRWINRH